MLQSSNQAPQTPVSNSAAATTTSRNPTTHVPTNDANAWPQQPKPSVPPIAQTPHGKQCYFYILFANNTCFIHIYLSNCKSMFSTYQNV